jgi:hypothetical protein
VAEKARKLVRLSLLLAAAALLTACGSPESKLRKQLAAATTGTIQLPSGRIDISSELRLGDGAHDLEIVGASNTLLKATDEFKGRAIIVGEGARNIKLRGFAVDGNRVVLERPLEMVPPENAFRVYYRDNGMLFDRVDGLEIRDVRFVNVTNFAILASRTSGIRIERVEVTDSGSRDAKGRNNMTGGIVIEEGARDFEVRGCTFRRIRGNALWTHSLYTSPRNEDGRFLENHFDYVGRDAIQVGHATRVRVEGNTGIRIGYPSEMVDAEHLGTPVAIDTAGNVDRSEYVRNRFEEINGKCIDLDGFHDGAVRENRCVNRLRVEEYPYGHFGIVMNNTNPDMHSQNVEIADNEFEGLKFGAIYLIGSGHRVANNVFRGVNLAGCNESAALFGCIYKKDEPDLLQSGIYLGRGVVRMEETKGNSIRLNEITGHGMKARCIAAAPGVSLAQNSIQANECSDEPIRR